MLHLYCTLMAALHRADKDERGDVLGFLAIGALVVTVVVFAVPGVKDVVTTVLDAIKTKIGGLA